MSGSGVLGSRGWSRVLAVVAHPDDEVIGCGGTLARCAAEGLATSVLIMSDGVGSRSSLRDALERRKAEAKRAAEEFGPNHKLTLISDKALADQRLDLVPIPDLSWYVSREILEFSPDVILTHWTGDLNADHRRVAEAVLVASRTVNAVILGFEVPETTALAPDHQFRPNVYVRLFGDCLETKITALHCYRSEQRLNPHPRSLEMVASAARVRGSQCGDTAAEAFVCYRDIL